MSYSAVAALLAMILTLSPVVVVSFTVDGNTYQYHGGSNLNETPAPIVGAGLPILLAGGAYLAARRNRRKSAS